MYVLYIQDVHRVLTLLMRRQFYPSGITNISKWVATGEVLKEERASAIVTIPWLRLSSLDGQHPNRLHCILPSLAAQDSVPKQSYLGGV